MDLNQYQTRAAVFALNNSLDHMVLGLAEEAGECAGHMKRYHRGDELYQKLEVMHHGIVVQRLISPTLKGNLEKELGDVLWYVAMTARSLGLSLEQIAETNISKLTDRAARNVIQGTGDDR